MSIWACAPALMMSYKGGNGTKREKKVMAQAAFKLRLPEELRKALNEAVERGGASVNTEIVRRLERSFEQPEHKIDVDKLRSELYPVLMELIELFVNAKEKEISSMAMGAFLSLSSVLAATYPSSDEKWGPIQRRLDAMAARGRELREQGK